MTRTLRPVVSGSATVHCVHDRQKRQVVTEADVAAVGLTAGLIYDSRIHRVFRCSCCENLFVDIADEPRFCTVCRQPPVHALGGPLPEPGGPVDE